MMKALRLLALCAAAAAPAAGAGGRVFPLATLSRSPYAESIGASLAPASPAAADALAYPGRAGFLDRSNASFGHALPFEDGSYDSVGAGFSTIERGAVAAGLYRLTSGPAESRDSQGSLTGTFRDEQTLLRMVYGGRALSSVGWGASVDFFDHSLAGESARSIGGGAGLQWSRGALSAGAAADDLVASVSGATGDRPKPALRLNGSWTLLERVQLGVDAAVLPGLDPRVAVQYSPLEALSLRLGRGSGGIGAGLGLRVRDYRLDYGTTIHQLGMAQQLTLSVSFGASRAARRRELSADKYRDARRLAIEGRYAAASRAMRDSARWEDPPLERRRFHEALQALVSAGAGDLSGLDSQSELRKGAGFYVEDQPQLSRALFLSAQAKDPLNEAVKRLLALVQRPEDMPAPPAFVDVDPIRLKLFKISEYFEKHQLDLALKECREIIAMDPRSVIGYVRLGSIYYALGVRDEAAKAWDYAAALAPEHPDVRSALKFMKEQKIASAGSRQGPVRSPEE